MNLKNILSKIEYSTRVRLIKYDTQYVIIDQRLDNFIHSNDIDFNLEVIYIKIDIIDMVLCIYCK